MKKCERCGKDVKNLISCTPNFEAPPLDVCEDCAEVLTRYEDFVREENTEEDIYE